MNLLTFKEYIKNHKPGTEFKYGISSPFSWRGSYDEVAFSILEEPMKKEEILEKIEDAYTGTFYGYKGGEYKYDDYTPVNFEGDYGSYTDGGYVSRMIERITDNYIQDMEYHLICSAFPLNN